MPVEYEHPQVSKDKFGSEDREKVTHPSQLQ